MTRILEHLYGKTPRTIGPAVIGDGRRIFVGGQMIGRDKYYLISFARVASSLPALGQCEISW
jgi:hypothetical protein